MIFRLFKQVGRNHLYCECDAAGDAAAFTRPLFHGHQRTPWHTGAMMSWCHPSHRKSHGKARMNLESPNPPGSAGMAHPFLQRKHNFAANNVSFYYFQRHNNNPSNSLNPWLFDSTCPHPVLIYFACFRRSCLQTPALVLPSPSRRRQSLVRHVQLHPSGKALWVKGANETRAEPTPSPAASWKKAAKGNRQHILPELRGFFFSMRISGSRAGIFKLTSPWQRNNYGLF